VAVLLGVAIAFAVPVINLINSISGTPPAAPLAIAIWAWGAILFLAGVASVTFTMHHETDLWGSLVAAIGIPSFLVVLMTGLLPHL
jgi:hypothetical protein